MGGDDDAVVAGENAGQQEAVAQQNQNNDGLRQQQQQQPQSQSGADTTPVVDHTPAAESTTQQLKQMEDADSSLAPQVAPEDRTLYTGPKQEDEEIYDDENEDAYGRIVDHTPKSTSKSSVPLNRMDSLAVQAPQDLDTVNDDDEEEEEDNIKINASSSREGERDDFPNGVVQTATEPCLVDHTPGDDDDNSSLKFSKKQRRSGNLSLQVLPSVGETMDDIMETESTVNDMDQAHDYGPIVDHTPQQNERPVVAMSSGGGDQSMAVTAPALEEDIREDEAMDDDDDSVSSGGDDDSTIETTTLDVDVGKPADGQVEGEEESSGELRPSLSVPHPKPSLSPREKQQQQHVVDHTPDDDAQDGQQQEAAADDPSIAALATEDDLTRDTGMGNEDEDVYDNENELDYAPVVDHTPPTPATTTRLTQSLASINSLAVHASALDEDFEQHDAMEETFSALDADEVKSGALISTVNAQTEKPLVDHTPSELGSPSPRAVKNTDPSVTVLASIEDTDNVGDEDDDDYGPVVDHLPTTPASGTRETQSDSVIVQGASAPDQDTVDGTTLADGGASTVGFADGDSTIVDDAAMSSFLRSPEGKLIVDHVPSSSSSARRSDSRLTGEAVSTRVVADPSDNLLLDGDDTVQEGDHFEFGPVVDHTPNPASATVEGTASGIPGANNLVKSNAVVDHVPHARQGGLADDSLATAGRSKLSEEDTEDEDYSSSNNNKFGPVVDHLPTPRPSMVSSARGCSTAGDLTAISEAVCLGDDTGGNSDWEDDLDMSLQSGRMALQQAPTSARQEEGRLPGVMSPNECTTPGSSPEKGASVRFDTSQFRARDFSSPTESQLQADLSLSSIKQPVDASSSSGWYDENGPAESMLPSSSFAEAETPPTTPHQRTKHGGKRTVRHVPVNEQLLQPFDLHRRQVGDTKNAPCCSKPSLECSCIQRLLHDNKKKNGSMFGTMITPEGTSIQVDFGKLLQAVGDNAHGQVEEIIRAAVQSVEDDAQDRPSMAELEDELLQMRQSNECFLERIETLQTESMKLRHDNSRLTENLTNARQQVKTMEAVSSKTASKTGAQEAIGEEDEVSTSSLRQENRRLTDNLSDAQRRIEELEQSKTAWDAKQSALESEIAKLKLGHDAEASVLRR